MSWWEVKRALAVMVAVDALAAALALGVCALVVDVNPVNFGTSIFIAGAALMFAGVGLGSGGGSLMGPVFRSHHSSRSGMAQEFEVMAIQRTQNIQHDVAHERDMSWTLVIGIGGLLLVPLGGFIVAMR